MLVLRRIFVRNFLHGYYSVAKRSTSAKRPLDFDVIKYESKVSSKSPTVSIESIKTEKIVINQGTLELLERLSLCNLSDKEALDTLEESIEFASKILHIDTANVQPMYFVHEDQQLNLREDTVAEGNIRDDLLKNATINDDTCFVAPPGNIPVEMEKKDFAQRK